jgi:hypothetical protein
MTAEEWTQAHNVEKLIYLVEKTISSRKLRLFTLGCCHRVSHLLGDGRCHRTIAVAETFADNGCGKAELELHRRQAQEIGENLEKQCRASDGTIFPHAYMMAAQSSASSAVAFAATLDQTRKFYPTPSGVNVSTSVVCEAACRAREAVFAATKASGGDDAIAGASSEAEMQAQMQVLRDVVGAPFSATKSVIAWQTVTVMSLATAIYADRAFDRLPILADALEDAGCDHADILNHCRGPGPHVLGCWPLDLVLGKS